MSEAQKQSGHGSLGDRLCAHGWPQATSDELSRLWFASQLPQICESVKESGARKGWRIELDFVQAGRFQNRFSNVMAVLSVDDLLVPFQFDALTLSGPRPSAPEIARLFIDEAERIKACRDALSARYRTMRDAALASARMLGEHSKLEALVLEPVMLGKDDPSNPQLPVQVRLSCLNSRLEPSSAEFSAHSPSEIGDYFAYLAPGQKTAIEQRERRRAFPTEIEVDKFAEAILERTTEAVDAIVALETGKTLNFEQIPYGNAILKDVSFFLDHGRVSTRFFFEGGEYNRGRLLVYRELPEMVKQSLLNRTTDAIVSGGVFDDVNATIEAYEDLNQLVRFTLAQEFVTARLATPWVCHAIA